jgi:hypothetical protein
MTVSTTEVRAEYVGDGSTTEFPVPFRFLEDSDLAVYSNATRQTLTTHYTVDGADEDEGGSITFLVAPASGVNVVVQLDMPIEQPADWINNDSFPAETLEREFDRGTLIDLQLDARLGRAMQFPAGEAGTVDWDTLLDVENRKGKYAFFFDETTGDPELYESLGDTTLSRSVIGGHLYPRTAGEIAAGVTPTYYYYQPGDFRRYGGDPTGVASSTAAMQAAIDSTGYVVYAGLIRLTTPIIGRDEMHMIGIGNPLVFNDEASSGGSGQCLVLGTYDDGGFTDSNAGYDALDNVTVDDDRVTCSTAADAANYPEGTVLYCWSSVGYTTGGGYFKPTYQQINVSAGHDAGTGEVLLRHKVYRTCANMRISRPADNLGHVGNDFTPQMVRDVTIEGTRFGSLNDAWSRYGGFINLTVRDCFQEYGNNILSMNGAAHSTFDNFRGNVDSRSWEFGYFSHDCMVLNNESHQQTDTTTAVSLGVFTFAEGAHHNTVLGCTGKYFDSTAALAVKFGVGSLHNKVINCDVDMGAIAFGCTVSNAEPLAEGVSGMDFGHNLIQGGTWKLKSVSGDLFSLTADAAANELGVEVRGLKVICPTIGAKLIDIGPGKNITFRDVDLRDVVADTITVDSTATQVRFLGNRLPTGEAAVSGALTALAQAGVDSRQNTITGREQVEAMNLVYGSATAIVATASSNSLVSRAVAAAAFAAGDALFIKAGGVNTGTDAHTIDVLWDGDVIMTFTSTLADEWSIDGVINLITVSTWKAVTRQTVGAAIDTIRAATTSDTAAISGNGLLEIRAYVGNAASSITIDYASVKYVPRY